MSLLLPASSICFRALFSAVGFTGALSLRCTLALWARLCALLPVIVGGVLLLGGESGVGVSTSPSSELVFEGPGKGAISASGEPIVCMSWSRCQRASVAPMRMRKVGCLVVDVEAIDPDPEAVVQCLGWFVECKRAWLLCNPGAPLDRAAQPPSILIRLSCSKDQYNGAGSATITMAARE